MMLAKLVSLVSMQLFGFGLVCFFLLLVMYFYNIFCFSINYFPRLFLEKIIMTA